MALTWRSLPLPLPVLLLPPPSQLGAPQPFLINGPKRRVQDRLGGPKGPKPG